MKLAKDRLDVGLITDRPDVIEWFRDDIDLGEPEILPVTRDMTQHRFDVDGSVVKVNLVDSLGTDRRSGYSEILIADPYIGESQAFEGPDHINVSIVTPGFESVEQLGVRLRVQVLPWAQKYFRDTLGWGVEEDIVRVGASVVVLTVDPTAPTVGGPTRGWSYLTVQVFDCDAETEAAVTGGARLVRDPVTLGDVARFSMVADPWGNQLEISQRASLTGPLPPNDQES